MISTTFPPVSTRRVAALRRALALGLVILLTSGVLVVPERGAAQPQFGLPFATDPGPSTWYVSQWYGNTVWAYRNWQDLYAAGQGLHFGVDFAARCGTEVVAIGDGVVFAVDGPYGSRPHNVVIDHGNGYLSLYGHLGRRSSLGPDQAIRRGDPVGVVGDPATDRCDQAPHLHLEIRRAGMGIAVNPVVLIDADWRSQTVGAQTDGTRFALDYANPGRWQHPHDQPEIRFGGPRLNNYDAGWPAR
jgi:murein DD-endopeptidase MepM/ murein hydrolase activator NlpD